MSQQCMPAGEDKLSIMSDQGRFHEDVFGATQQFQIEGAASSATGLGQLLDSMLS